MAAAAGYAVQLLCIAAMRHRGDKVVATREKTWRVIGAGQRHLRDNPPVAGVLAATVVLNFFGFSYAAMLPVIG